uniref:Uncharacterized protein n=1 Tax=Setaria italica TaxID=4555 RepID=K3YB04_SETIT
MVFHPIEYPLIHISAPVKPISINHLFPDALSFFFFNSSYAYASGMTKIFLFEFFFIYEAKRKKRWIRIVFINYFSIFYYLIYEFQNFCIILDSLENSKNYNKIFRNRIFS